ncbi:NAD(P)H-dependent FMN reductase [Raineyella antarctica]|uniref:NAD(P)H-dependent FMN reductase n=1 Tax=Raineyella antarctica TaxID=1577474 RepID=A0A1G6GJP4_9ACTN|nr:NAD(P)H-dependent oxidoreductase [Raineyella antarctica]SDB82063.1 NAD(P)H-dependent FMN reductase [Raineyella antarctica]
MSSSIMVIVGSTRKVRNGRGIADAISAVLSEDPQVTIDLADLAEITLTPEDEPLSPMMGQYQLPTTRAWSQRVISADAVVLVTPEYNGGYPASLKNAVDAIAKEWAAKPLAVASYGFYGGVRAHRQLSEIMGNLESDLVEVEQGLNIQFGQQDLNEQFRLVDPAAVVERHRDAVVAVREALLARANDESVRVQG